MPIGAVSLLSGLVLLFRPGTIVAVLWLFEAYTIIFGVLLLFAFQR